MSTLQSLFKKSGITLYQNESLDLDHYYQEPYQDTEDASPDQYQMGEPFEKNHSKQKRKIDTVCERESNFSFFMDGSRRTYKIGDIVLEKSKIYPVVVAQVRAGCGYRGSDRKVQKHLIEQKNLLLVTSRFNNSDFLDLKIRIGKGKLAKELNLDVVQYSFEKTNDLTPTNAAIAKANSIMHEMEISILQQMVNSKDLDTEHLLIVDGPLQFLKEDTGKKSFADLFYNVVGVSKTFDPMLPISERSRGGAQVGSQLLNLEYGERTPVFHKKNSRGREFGCWYLRIRPKSHVSSPLEGIIKVEKMACEEDLEEGFDSDIIDNISHWLIEEGCPTCHGKDERWAAHLYPVYLTEKMVKSTFMGDLSFVHQFKKEF